MTRLFTFLTAVLTCGALRAQIPVDREPHHKILLQNSYVRILEGRIPQNDTTPLHRHAANSVVIFLSHSTFGIGTAGSPPAISTVNPGDTKYAAYGDKPVDHTVWNQSRAPFHFYVVEIGKRATVHDSSLVIRKGETFRLPAARCARLLVSISGTISAGDQRLTPYRFRFFPPDHPVDLHGAGRCLLLEIR